jgi:transcription elongation factor Elf1
MEKHIECNYCKTENIVIENKLFFTEEQKETNVICAACDEILLVEKTDGWFFVQTINEFKFEMLIEEQKKEIVFG